MEFSEKIKLIRKHNHLTQEAFAQRINVSRKTVSGWENGRSVPDKHTLEIISLEFDISIHNLTDKNIGNIFDTNQIEKKYNSKKQSLVYYLLFIQFIMIVISYLSLLKLFTLPINTIFLLVNTVFLSYSIQHNIKSSKTQKNRTLIGGFNFVIGVIVTLIYLKMNLNNTNVSIYFISGLVIGTVIHVIVLTKAVSIFIYYLSLRKKRMFI